MQRKALSTQPACSTPCLLMSSRKSVLTNWTSTKNASTVRNKGYREKQNIKNVNVLNGKFSLSLSASLSLGVFSEYNGLIACIRSV